MKWITAKALEVWSGTITARTVFPALIADLIRASATSIGAFRFPNGDKGQVRGFDGWLTSDGAPPYVPEGDSLWEFGITPESLGKASDDLEKRTKQVAEDIRIRTTFVFVTPHTWDNPHKRLPDQVADMRRGRGWKDVLFIDGAQLEDWLFQCPAVAAWYARTELKTAPQIGARSSEEFWDWYSNRFAPQITEEVLLCGREAETETVLKELVSSPSRLRFAADSPDEVIAFAIAAVRKSAPELRQFLESRIMIVETEDAAHFLARSNNLIFMPRSLGIESSGLLASKGPTLLAIGGNQTRGDHKYLSRPSAYELAKAIETMAVDETSALELARAAGRSLTILARRIPGGNAVPPEWAPTAAQILPAILAGGWDATNDGDKSIIEMLWNAPRYSEVEGTLRQYTRMQDPPIDREGHVWRIRAPVDAFINAGHLIGSHELDRLGAAATAVFSEIVEAPKADELYRSDPSRNSTHSAWLKEGLATTILQLAVLGRRAEVNIAGIDPQHWVDDLIDGLPGLRDDGRLIASLRDQLPLLMEAAPIPLLSALEQLLEGDNQIATTFFWDRDPMFGPTSPHVYLLWALEPLAWDPRMLPRIARILARLAELDSGDENRGNRPIGTLRSIFLSWNPNTNANLDQRLLIIDQIVARTPQVGWQLLVSLLPKSHDSNSPTQKPRFREVLSEKAEKLTNAVVWRSQAALVDKVLSLAVGNPKRLSVVIDSLYNWSPDHIDQALSLVDNYLYADNSEQRLAIWTDLSEMARKHRAFSETDWALPADVLARVEEIVERHQSQEPLERVSWLFNDWLPDMPGSLDERERQVAGARQAAVREIFGAHGRAGILRLVECTSLPHTVAEAVGTELANDDEDIAAYIADAVILDSQKSLDFALVLSAVARNKNPEGWAERLSRLVAELSWSPELTAKLLLAWPDETQTWNYASTFGENVEREYWLRKRPFAFRNGLDEALQGVENYLKVGRPSAALTSLHRLQGQIPSATLLTLLDALLTEITSADRVIDNMLAYHVEHVLEELDQRSDISSEDIAVREYAYLPLLRERDRPLAIHRLMAVDPAFYLSLLSSVFREEGQTNEDATLDEEASSSKAQKAKLRTDYRLLSEFHTLPGTTPDGIDSKVLKEWVFRLRQMASEQKRIGVADTYVGRIFAHAPPDQDGNWPDAAVSALIEEIASERLEHGLSIEAFNKRGVYSKAIYEGGRQERELAGRYRIWSDVALSKGFVRTSTMLEGIAKGWDAEAEREDLRARQDKLRS